MREVAPSEVVARRTFNVHVRPTETSWSLSAYGMDGGEADAVDEFEKVARSPISLTLDLPADAFDVVVRILADPGTCRLYPEVPTGTGDPAEHVGVRPGRGFREHW